MAITSMNNEFENLTHLESTVSTPPQKIRADISEDTARLAAIVARSRAEIAQGIYYTQEEMEQDSIELLKQIDNLA